MAEEIAGLFVSIGVDLSELQSGLEETQSLLEDIDLGNITSGLGQIPLQFQQMIAGIQAALLPLPTVIANSLQGSLDSALTAVANSIQKRGDEIIAMLYSVAARIQNIAAQLGLANPIRSEGLEGRASGGSVMSGQPYLVGEAGPELFVPGASGTIIPHHALGGGEGLSIQGGTFHIYGVQDVESLFDQLQQVARQRA